MAARDHGEQHVFLLRMWLSSSCAMAEVVGQTSRTIRALAMHLLDLARQADEFGQLLAVYRVEAVRMWSTNSVGVAWSQSRSLSSRAAALQDCNSSTIGAGSTPAARGERSDWLPPQQKSK